METPPFSEVLPNPCGYARGLLLSIARYPYHDAKIRYFPESCNSCIKNYSFCIKKHSSKIKKIGTFAAMNKEEDIYKSIIAFIAALGFLLCASL